MLTMGSREGRAARPATHEQSRLSDQRNRGSWCIDKVKALFGQSGVAVLSVHWVSGRISDGSDVSESGQSFTLALAPHLTSPHLNSAQLSSAQLSSVQLAHSLTHLLTHHSSAPLSSALLNSLTTHSAVTHSPTHLPIHSLTHSPTQTPIHPSTHSFMRQSIIRSQESNPCKLNADNGVARG